MLTFACFYRFSVIQYTTVTSEISGKRWYSLDTDASKSYFWAMCLYNCIIQFIPLQMNEFVVCKTVRLQSNCQMCNNQVHFWQFWLIWDTAAACSFYAIFCSSYFTECFSLCSFFLVEHPKAKSFDSKRGSSRLSSRSTSCARARLEDFSWGIFSCNF